MYNRHSTKEEPMPSAILHYDLGLLITLAIGLAILGLLMTFAGIWAMIWQLQRNARESREGMREITQSTREVAFMIRTPYGAIDPGLQGITNLPGGSDVFS